MPLTSRRQNREGQFSEAEMQLLRNEFQSWIVDGVPRQNMQRIEAVIRKEGDVLGGRSYRCIYFKLKRMHAAYKKSK